MCLELVHWHLVDVVSAVYLNVVCRAIPNFLSGAIIARGRVCSGQEVGDKAGQTKISDAGLHC